MRRWVFLATLVLSLPCLLPPAWSLTLSSAPGSLPTVSCPDVGGNHLNFSGGVWTCGVTSSGVTPGNARADSTTKGIATFTSEFIDNGSGLIGLAPTLLSHTLGPSNTFVVRDDRFTLQDDTDGTKQARFQLSSITSGQLRVFTLPDVEGPLVTTGAPQTLLGKSLSGVNNTITQLPETALALSDVATGNATILAHGFLPKIPGDPATVLRGDGTYGAAPGSPSGAAGTLQVSNGAGGFGAYLGAQCLDPTTVQVGLTATGEAVCQTAPGQPLTAHVLTDRVEAAAPNAVALSALPAGLLRTSVTGGVAALSTVPHPAGDLLGTLAVQEVDNKRINARVVPLPNAATLTLDLSTMDAATVSELSQPTTFVNPTGLAKAGQLLRLSVHSTLPQALLWGPLFTEGVGFPLPTATSGGLMYDTFWFQYNAITGTLDIIFNSQLSRLVQPTGVIPGTYACPASQTVDALGRVTAIVAGPCGGGGPGTAAGAVGDVQVKGATGLTSDSGRFTQDVQSHWTAVQQLLAGTGTGALTLADPRGFSHTLRSPNLTASRVSYMPDRNGVVPLTSGGTSGHLAVFDTDGVGLVDGGAPGAGGGGNVSSSGTPSAGQAAEWVTATTIQGVGTSGAGDYVKTNSPTMTTPTFIAPSMTRIASLTSNGIVVTSGGDGTLGTTPAPTGAVVGTSDAQTLTAKRIPPRITTLSSAATNPSFACDFAAGEDCEVQATGAASTITMAAPSGTLQNGEMRKILFLCTNAMTITWDPVFIASPTVPLPSACPSGTTTWFAVGFRYSTVLNKNQILASN